MYNQNQIERDISTEEFTEKLYLERFGSLETVSDILLNKPKDKELDYDGLVGNHCIWPKRVIDFSNVIKILNDE